MGTRTGEELLEAMRDGRQLFIDGHRVEDVTTDPRFGAAARSLAQLYDMQHEPALIERMTFLSPTSGERVGLSFIEPRSIDDLIRRRDMVKIWADATCGMFGRSPDYMNIFITAFASAAKEFGKKDKSLAENIRGYHGYIREERHLYDPYFDQPAGRPLAARRETGQGSRSEDRQGDRRRDHHPRRAHGVPLCAYSDDLLVLPSTYIANSKEAEPYEAHHPPPVEGEG
jgi:4-hydroxyphenylacetate 3-monooxygenase